MISNWLEFSSQEDVDCQFKVCIIPTRKILYLPPNTSLNLLRLLRELKKIEINVSYIQPEVDTFYYNMQLEIDYKSPEVICSASCGDFPQSDDWKKSLLWCWACCWGFSIASRMQLNCCGFHVRLHNKVGFYRAIENIFLSWRHEWEN